MRRHASRLSATSSHIQLALVDVQLGLMARRNRGSLVEENLIRASRNLGGCGKQRLIDLFISFQSHLNGRTKNCDIIYLIINLVSQIPLSPNPFIFHFNRIFYIIFLSIISKYIFKKKKKKRRNLKPL